MSIYRQACNDKQHGVKGSPLTEHTCILWTDSLQEMSDKYWAIVEADGKMASGEYLASCVQAMELRPDPMWQNLMQQL